MKSVKYPALDIKILQGGVGRVPKADVNIVIDVIRAFTVAHIAFIGGVERIYMVRTVEEAFKMKREYPDRLLCGEVEGLAIEGFDFDNSPQKLEGEELTGKTLVQRTTNGVRMALKSLDAGHVLVTGFTCARRSAGFVRQRVEEGVCRSVNLIASHPTSDDDLACAEYMESIVRQDGRVKSGDVIDRINRCEVAGKFFDLERTKFCAEDIRVCTREIPSDFVMSLDKSGPVPFIRKEFL